MDERQTKNRTKTGFNEAVVLDVAFLDEFTGNDTELRKLVLNVFCDNAPEYLEKLITVTPGDWKSSAHKLKGAARSIGAWQLARHAERAEHMVPPALDSVERMTIVKALGIRLQKLLREIKVCLTV